MDSLIYILGFIAVATLATFSTRAVPFVLFRGGSDNRLLRYLGRYLPPVMMVLLLTYASTDLPAHWGTGVALILVAVAQWFGKNPLVSIALGTLVYALLS